MAAGRGEFFQSYVEGLDRNPVQPARGRRRPGRGQGGSGPGGRQSGPGQGGSGPGAGQSCPGVGRTGRGYSGPGGRHSGRGQEGSGPGVGQSGRGRGGPGEGQSGSGAGVRQSGHGPGGPGPGVRQSGRGRGGSGLGVGQSGRGRGGSGPGVGGSGPGVGQSGRGRGGSGLGVGQSGRGRGGSGPGVGGSGPGVGQSGRGRGGSGPGVGGSGPGVGQSGRGRGGSGPGVGQSGRGRGGSGPGVGGSGPGVGQSGRGRGGSGPGVGGSGETGGEGRQKPPEAAAAAPGSVGGSRRSCSNSRFQENTAGKVTFKKNVIESLPSEILLQILSFLDATSLSCLSHVSRLFHRLANDDVVWQNVYMSAFGSQTWRPKLTARDAALKVEREEAGHWKRMYFRTLAGREIKEWVGMRHDVSPYTGLPRQTERVLRNLDVSWELAVSGLRRKIVRIRQSRAYFFESSLIVRWSDVNIPDYNRISNIQLYAVQKDRPTGPADRRPGLRSMIWGRRDATEGEERRRLNTRVIGEDVLVKLRHLRPGFIIGTYRGQKDVAFIMVSLHFHKLVEKCLMGAPSCPFRESYDTSAEDISDPEFGLHDYALHFVLHNTGAEIMSGNFRQLSCPRGQIQNGLLELRVIDRSDLSQHRPLSGNIKLPWKSSTLEGSVENCCIMSLTLLDEFQNPFWCVSAPVRTTMAKYPVSFDYSGEHYLMSHRDGDGRVRMRLVWFTEQKQFFLVGLSVYVSVAKVNRHFHRAY